MTVVVFLIFLYFLPVFVGAMRQFGKKDKKLKLGGSVAIINLFFGWTLIGWVIALCMAVDSSFVKIEK